MKHSPEFVKLVDEAKRRIREISPEEVRQRIADGEKMILVDVREDNEWEKGHIQNAVHLGRGIIERDIISSVPDKGNEIILYCGGGYRSALAADNLQKMGYTRVLSMSGGWRRWNELGYPME